MAQASSNFKVKIKETIVISELLQGIFGRPEQCPTRYFKKWSEINWRLFLRLIEWNKTVSFFSHLLSCRECQKEAPSFFLRKLDKLYEIQLARFVVYKTEKKQIEKLLRADKIKACFFKDFLRYIPKDSICPPSSLDIDLLIDKKDERKLGKSLLAKNYSLIKEVKYRKGLKKSLARVREYRKKNSPYSLLLDVHFQIATPTEGKISPLSFDKVQAISDDVLRQTSSDYFLSPAPLLFILCLHFFFKDSCQGWRHLYDIASLVKSSKNKIDWRELYQIAENYRLFSYVFFILYLAQLHSGVRLPLLAERKIAGDKRIRLAAWLYDPFFITRVLSHEERIKKNKGKLAKNYFFFIKLILLEKNFLWKLYFIFRPGVIWPLFRYLIPLRIRLLTLRGE